MSGSSSNDANEPIESADNNLSKVMGQLSVTADNSNETLTQPKNLSDMPADVVGLIIERSDYREQLILRKTSKSLRELVDKQKPSCTRLEVSCKVDCIFCCNNDHCVAYVSPTWDKDDFWSKYEHFVLNTIISKTDYEKVAFDDLASILKTPKLQLEYFSFDSEDITDDDLLDYVENFDSFELRDDRNWEYCNKFKNMQNILKSINHQLSVKACRIDISDLSYAMSILPYLKPGVLEKITMYSQYDEDGWSEYSETIGQFALLDQWKQAKELQIECGFDEEFPVKHATHFKRFQFNEGYIKPDTLVIIRDYLSEHENIEFCSISFKLLAEGFDDILGAPVSPNSYHYTVPNSEYYLEFMIKDKLITIEKKKKQ